MSVSVCVHDSAECMFGAIESSEGTASSSSKYPGQAICAMQVLSLLFPSPAIDVLFMLFAAFHDLPRIRVAPCPMKSISCLQMRSRAQEVLPSANRRQLLRPDTVLMQFATLIHIPPHSSHAWICLVQLWPRTRGMFGIATLSGTGLPKASTLICAVKQTALFVSAHLLQNAEAAGVEGSPLIGSVQEMQCAAGRHSQVPGALPCLCHSLSFTIWPCSSYACTCLHQGSLLLKLSLCLPTLARDSETAQHSSTLLRFCYVQSAAICYTPDCRSRWQLELRCSTQIVFSTGNRLTLHSADLDSSRLAGHGASHNERRFSLFTVFCTFLHHHIQLDINSQSRRITSWLVFVCTQSRAPCVCRGWKGAGGNVGGGGGWERPFLVTTTALGL